MQSLSTYFLHITFARISSTEKRLLCAGSTPAEAVIEATADSGREAYAEHVFADPLGAQHAAEALAGYSQR